jgi:hypothetical protein
MLGANAWRAACTSAGVAFWSAGNERPVPPRVPARASTEETGASAYERSQRSRGVADMPATSVLKSAGVRTHASAAR